MKNIKKLLAVGLLASVALAGVPVEKLVPVENIYSPNGFDSNDNAEIIIEGYLPNLCHKAPFKKVRVDGNKIHISISAYNYDSSNPFCPEVIVPFLESVDVGVLDKGDYEVIVNGHSMYEKKSNMRVYESSSDAVDENVYANVEFIEKEAGSRVVKLKGYNPSDCFEKDEINVINNKKDVYSILPKMKQVSDFCPMKMVPFEYELEVPKNLDKDKVLLHVRVMNGKSVNSVFNNKLR